MSLVPYGGDPSSPGGICRQKCDSQPNPQACCALKSKLPSCNDADCRWGTYIGGNNMAWNPNTNTVTYQNTWPNVSFNLRDPRPYAYTTQPSTPGPYGPMLGEDCRTWVPCRLQKDPVSCCAAKPRGCDTLCDIIGTNVINPPVSPVVTPVVSPVVTPVVGSNCASWGPCSTRDNPQSCCATKAASGCSDTWCSAYGGGMGGNTYVPPHREYNPYDFTPYSGYQNGFDQNMYNQFTNAPYTHPMTPAPQYYTYQSPMYQQNPNGQYWTRYNNNETMYGSNGTVYGSNDKLYGVDKGFYGEFGS